MKKNICYFALFICSTLFFTSCVSLTSHVKKYNDSTIAFEPGPLELHGNTVDFEITAKMPSKLLKKNIKNYVEVYYQPKNKEAFKIGQFNFNAKDHKSVAKKVISLKQNFSFEFQDGYNVGDLIVKGTSAKGEKIKSSQQVVLPENGAMTSMGKK